MMRRLSLLIVLAALPLASGSAQTGPKPTASASASAQVIHNDLNLSQQWVLAFGLVKSSSEAGTVVVRPQGIRSPFAGAEVIGSGPCHLEFCEDETNPNNPASASYWGPGKFQISGSPGASYRISADTSATAYWRTPASGRVPELEVTAFTFLSASNGDDTGVLDANGIDTVQIGGTLVVPSGMKTASYRVQVPVQVQYN